MGHSLRQRFLFGLALVSAIAHGVVTGPSKAAAQRTVTIRAGDALSLLAERHHVSVDELRRWNDLEGDQIQIGQELVVAPEGVNAATGAADAGTPEYEVAAGDTLSGIATRMNVTVEDLVAWNEGISPDSIRVGQHLVVGTPRFRIEHRVRAGESLSRIAARYEVRVADIVRWNRSLGRRRVLREGATLLVWAERPQSRSEAVGLPHHGELVHGEPLPSHRGYVIRDRQRAYGTRETNDAIVEAFDTLRAVDARAPKLRVHDLSARTGGPMADHRSHQNGRDVDISYFHRRGCPADGCGFRRLGPGDLDVERTWTLLHAWLAKDQAQAVFIDYSLQGVLYREARRRGATRQELHRWFQFPRGTGYPLGIIRHFPHHRDHMHVRFRCAEDDEECR